MGVKFNPLSGNFDLVNETSVTQYDNVDKTSPVAGDVWVKRTVGVDGVVGEPRGMLLALTYSGAGTSAYELSYQTNESTIIRTVLS